LAFFAIACGSGGGDGAGNGGKNGGGNPAGPSDRTTLTTGATATIGPCETLSCPDSASGRPGLQIQAAARRDKLAEIVASMG